MSAKHVIVVSYDAFAAEDWSLAASLPNMARLLEKGAYSDQLQSVDPSLTYVAHTTMVTGVSPHRHGILHNNPFQPFVAESEQAWHWFHNQIQVPTLYDLVQEQGGTTAAILWPVTAGAKIKYHLPEVRAIGKENQILKVLRYGSPFYCLDMERRFGSLRKGIEQPNLDNFIAAVAAHTLRTKQPNLMLIHFIELDEMKHHHGTQSVQAKRAIVNMDEHLGQLIKAAEEAGILDETVFVVIGDHSQLDYHTKIYLNRHLREMGIILETATEKTWKAWFQSTGGGAYLHFAPGAEETKSILLKWLEEVSLESDFGIERFFELSGLIFVEAKSGYCFDDDWQEPNDLVPTRESTTGATHGYSKERENYSSNLLVSGPGIRNHSNLGPVRMVDIAPTLAALFELPFSSEGTVLRHAFLPSYYQNH
jgi:predicted AlkP superfamily pyrophosphatase or phosphodiesterase